MAVRPGGAEDPASRIWRIIDFQDRRFQAVFISAVNLIRDRWSLEELADLLEAGRFEEALASLEAAALLIGNQYGEALAASARDTAAFLSGALTVTVSFDQTNVRAVEQMAQNRLRLIQEFTNEQRTVLRTVMTRGIQEGLNPREQARQFRDSVGLTEYQESQVQRYRQLLSARQDGLPSRRVLQRELRDGRADRTIERALRRGEPLTPTQIDSMVSRYRQNYIRYRAEVIGRTEALRSVHQGTEEMYQQAFDTGALDPRQVVRTWTARLDSRTRDSHEFLSGQKRLVGEAWTTSNGPIRYPGDLNAPASETIQCRCALATRIIETPEE